MGKAMLMKVKTYDDLIEALSLRDLFDPSISDVFGRYQEGRKFRILKNLPKPI